MNKPLRNRIMLFVLGCWSLLFSTTILFPTQPASAYSVQNVGPRGEIGSDKWGSPVFGQPGGLVTWSLMPQETAWPTGVAQFTHLGGFLPTGYVTTLQWAFNQWASVANITFVQVPDNGAFIASTPNAGMIRIGGTAFECCGVFAITQQSVGTASELINPSSGNILFNTNVQWTLTDEGPLPNFGRVALHEIGHAIGLDHTSMSAVMNPNYTEAFPLGLLADDIAGAQFIYGPAGSGEAGSEAPIPEPATLLLFGSGLAGLAAKRRMRSS